MLNRIVTVAALAAGGILLSKQLKKSRNASGMMSSVTESIDVNAPLSATYNQWTQFEEFPRFMDGVQEVRQMGDTRLHWRATVGGKPTEWDSEITEQIPDDRIAWRSVSGVRNAGVVTFHKISDSATRVTLQMDYDPQSITEKVGDAFGVVKMQARSNLKRFKEMIEGRGGQESGAWRGTVAQH